MDRFVKLFGVYDVKSDRLVSSFESSNVDTAIRSFKSSLANTPPLLAEDLRLLHLGDVPWSPDAVIYPSADELKTMEAVNNG